MIALSLCAVVEENEGKYDDSGRGSRRKLLYEFGKVNALRVDVYLVPCTGHCTDRSIARLLFVEVDTSSWQVIYSVLLYTTECIVTCILILQYVS